MCQTHPCFYWLSCLPYSLKYSNGRYNLWSSFWLNHHREPLLIRPLYWTQSKSTIIWCRWAPPLNEGWSIVTRWNTSVVLAAKDLETALKLSVKSLNTTIFRRCGKALFAVQDMSMIRSWASFKSVAWYGATMNGISLPGDGSIPFPPWRIYPFLRYFWSKFLIFWILFILQHFTKSGR